MQQFFPFHYIRKGQRRRKRPAFRPKQITANRRPHQDGGKFSFLFLRAFHCYVYVFIGIPHIGG